MIFIIFFLIGIGVTSFSILPILIIFVFGIPITKKLGRAKMLKENNNIVKRYLISSAVLFIIFCVILTVTFLFINSGFVGLIVGVGATFLFGLGQIGKNKNNIHDYMKVNNQYFTHTLEETYLMILK